MNGTKERDQQHPIEQVLSDSRNKILKHWSKEDNFMEIGFLTWYFQNLSLEYLFSWVADNGMSGLELDNIGAIITMRSNMAFWWRVIFYIVLIIKKEA